MSGKKSFPICGAKTRSGEPCKNRQMANGRCRFHGGKTPKGMGLPQFKHGRYSKYMPKRLLERYDQAVQDPELLSLREEVAALDARIADVMLRVDTGESGNMWKVARDAFKALELATRRKEEIEQGIQFRKLGSILGHGIADYSAWNELKALFQDRRRLVESERKRRVEEQLTMTLEEGMNLMTAMTMAVKQNVEDRATLVAIQDAFIRLSTVSPAPLVIDG